VLSSKPFQKKIVDIKVPLLLNGVMVKTSKEEHLYKVFADAFHEVVEPHLEEIKNRLDKVDIQLDKVVSKLDKVDDRLDRHGTMLDKHEKRITSLEESPLVH
jgi:peptidoglycan hydrolase CwlO-like protein